MPEEIRLTIGIEEKGTPGKGEVSGAGSSASSGGDKFQELQKEWDKLLESGTFRLKAQTSQFKSMQPSEPTPHEKPEPAVTEPDETPAPVLLEKEEKESLPEKEEKKPRPKPPPPPVKSPPLPTKEKLVAAEVVSEGPSLAKRVGGGLAETAKGAVPSFVAGGVGAATGSGTLGGVAGTATSSAMAGGAMGGPLGVAIGATVVATVALVEVFGKLKRAVGETADSIGEYSPDVARAEGYAELRHELSMIRRAEKVGKEMGEYTTAESKLQNSLDDLKTTIVRDIGPAVTKMLTWTTGLTVVIDEVWKLASKLIDDLGEIPIIGEALKNTLLNMGKLNLLEKITDALEEFAKIREAELDAKEVAAEAEILKFLGVGPLNAKAFEAKLEKDFGDWKPAPRELPNGVMH